MCQIFAIAVYTMLQLKCRDRKGRGSIMKSNKLSTFFLCFLLVFTLLVAAGCGKDDPEEKGDKPDVVDNKGNNGTDNKDSDGKDNKNDDTKKNEDNNNGSSTTKKVKLLKRNGVEWKENTKINSKVGAKSYKVVWGDTLSLIARTWHVNCYTLAKYNGIKNIDLIEVDQIIYNYKAK